MRPSRVATVGLVIGLVLSTVVCWGARNVQQDQESHLLRGRAGEVGLILTQAINAIPARLKAQGALLNATDQSVSAYEKAAAIDVTAGARPVSYAWLRSSMDGSFVVLGAQGSALRQGQVVADDRAATMNKALQDPLLISTGVLGQQRAIGFALGPPAAPAGTVLYQQNMLGPQINPPRQAASAPFSNLDVALYSAARPDPAQVLVSTSTHLPLTGKVELRTLPVGSGTWVIAASAQEPLTGRLAAAAPWLLLGGGILLSFLVAAVVETTDRRRRDALERYRSERASTELFQRNLLPRLPALPELDIAARYLPSERGQEVGGDWFDVFPLPSGEVGVVIGDVMGHDLLAASGMAQVRSALRAFARQEQDPGRVLDLLDDLVTSLEVTELATVFYGSLGAPGSDGSRLLRWCNAGHLPPVLRLGDGSHAVLHDGSSLLIGSPLTVLRETTSRVIPSGATLLLFTDGLVETPGGALDDAIEALAASLSTPGILTADALCEVAVSTLEPRARRDDVALLAVRTLIAAPHIADDVVPPQVALPTGTP